MPRLSLLLPASLACLAACGGGPSIPARAHGPGDEPALWRVYHDALAGAKYVDLTHTITPTMPVWPGFGRPTFGPSVDPKSGEPYRWDKDGFEATRSRPTGARTIRLSTSCRRRSPSGRWS
jgi:hypothetical protein